MRTLNFYIEAVGTSEDNRKTQTRQVQPPELSLTSTRWMPFLNQVFVAIDKCQLWRDLTSLIRNDVYESTWYRPDSSTSSAKARMCYAGQPRTSDKPRQAVTLAYGSGEWLLL